MSQNQDNMERPDNLNQVALAINAAGVGIIAVIFVAFYWGLYAQLESREVEVFSKEFALTEFLDRQDELIRSNLETKKRLDEQKGRLAELVQRIPNTPHESNFLEQLANVAASSDVDIRDFNPGNTIQQGKHSQLEIYIVGSASYEGICRFLDGLAKLPRLCQIASFEVTSPSGGSSDYKIEAKLRIFFAPTMASNAKQIGVSHV